jgi:enamine deaminase RidA (YjgF/YER057c/UK114 family)
MEGGNVAINRSIRAAKHLMIEAVNPTEANWPGLSQGVIARDGNLMFLSGQVAAPAEGGGMPDDFEAQVRSAFDSLGAVLAAAGVGFDALVRLTYYVTDYTPALIAVIKAVRTPLLSAERPPASVLIPVAELYDPAVRIEIEAIAVVPSGAGV